MTDSYLRQRNVEAEIKSQQDPGDQYDEDGESCILEVRELHLHRSEFSPPSDMRVLVGQPGGRRLPPTSLPVGGLQALEVIHTLLIVQFDLTCIQYDMIRYIIVPIVITTPSPPLL